MEKSLFVTVSTGHVFLITALFLFAYVCLCALIAIRKKRADIADIAWGFGFFLVAWVSFSLSPKTLSSFIVNLLITAWAVRLAIHIYLRNRNRKEDFRYENLKKQWGQKNIALRMFLQVFLLQGVILYIVALPILWINTHPYELTLAILFCAFPIWLAGFLFETIGDYQLLKFLKDPSHQGKLLTTGLWSYVRHPNYLGEITQWWAIWGLTLFLPLLISPLLITFLIIKVSGIAPLEEKMKHHPDFAQYAKTTPSLLPFSLVNGAIYTLAWIILVWFGAQNFSWIPQVVFVAVYVLQISLFSKYDSKSLLVCIPLSIYALLLGLIQETGLIHFDILNYSNQKGLPPFWLLSLYPLFSLTLNSSLSFLNRNLPFTFCIGGLGAFLSYLTGERLGAVQLASPLSAPITFVCWGAYLTLLILLNRRLMTLREKYTNPENLGNPITVIFDPQCPICSREMCILKKRKQTGAVIYATANSDLDLQKITTQFSYSEAMREIHAIDSQGTILKGIDVLSELYARTNLPILSVLIQAPGFRTIFKFAYAIWAKLR